MDELATNGIFPYQWTLYSVFWLIIGLVILFYAVWKGFHEAQGQDSSGKWTDAGTVNGVKSFCESPDCVRCNKYKMIIHAATDRLFELLEQPGTRPDDLPRLLKAFEGKSIIPSARRADDSQETQQPTLFSFPDLMTIPFWRENGHDTLGDAVDTLKQNYANILSEFNEVFKQMDTRWSINNTPNGVWSVYYFFNQGRRLEENCQACPGTVAVLDSLPGLMKDCVFGNAGFSVIYPGTDIEEHYGPTNVRLRCHLGLNIPRDCWLKVKGEQIHWEEKDCLFFDDSFLHSAHHHGDDECSPRAVLLLDLWHPELTPVETDALRYIFPADK